MKVNLYPSEMERLIKSYEAEQSELEEAYGDYQTYIKLDENYEHLMYDISRRIRIINTRLDYLKSLYEYRTECMKYLNSIYGVNSDKKENSHDD